MSASYLSALEKHRVNCLRLSHILLAVSILLTALFQGMAFFIALHGGYDSDRALIFSLIPFLGPLFCGFQLAFAGTGSPLILFTLFVPCALTFFGWAYFHDENVKACKNIAKINKEHNDSCITIKQENILQEKLKIKPEKQPVPKPIPTVNPKPKPEKLPSVKPGVKPAPLKNIKHIKSKNKNNIDSINDKVKSNPAKILSVPKTGIEEYDEALSDVLSILNK